MCLIWYTTVPEGLIYQAVRTSILAYASTPMLIIYSGNNYCTVLFFLWASLRATRTVAEHNVLDRSQAALPRSQRRRCQSEANARYHAFVATRMPQRHSAVRFELISREKAAFESNFLRSLRQTFAAN